MVATPAINARCQVGMQNTRSLAVAKLAFIEKKLLELANLRDVLRRLVPACDQPQGESWPIIEQLKRDLA